jgi:hypothetical protein
MPQFQCNQLTNQQRSLNKSYCTDAERIRNIVESKNCPENLNKIATECHLLNADQQETLHKLLRKFAHLFHGTLGNGKTDLVDLELKDK